MLEELRQMLREGKSLEWPVPEYWPAIIHKGEFFMDAKEEAKALPTFEVGQLRFQKGDVVVLRFLGPTMSVKDMQATTDYWYKTFRDEFGVKLVAFAPGQEISIMRQMEEADL